MENILFTELIKLIEVSFRQQRKDILFPLFILILCIKYSMFNKVKDPQKMSFVFRN